MLYDVDDKHVRARRSGAAASSSMRRARSSSEKWTGYAALFDYTDGARAGAGRRGRTSRWLWPFFRPFKRTLVGAAAPRPASRPALQMVLPVFTQVIVDHVLVERDLGLLYLLLAGMAACSSS